MGVNKPSPILSMDSFDLGSEIYKMYVDCQSFFPLLLKLVSEELQKQGFQPRVKDYREFMKTATPARTSSDILQSKYCFHKLPLMYYSQGQNGASYNSEVPGNHIFSFTTNIEKD